MQAAISELLPEPTLRVENLSIGYRTVNGLLEAVRGATFEIAPGEVLGVVGESGSGKSTLAHAMIGYQPPASTVTTGRVMFGEISLLESPKTALRSLWGRRLAMVHQNALATLTPTMTIGTQIAEVIREHEGVSLANARERALESLRAVNIPSPRSLISRYPHQLSGGQRQRVSIAIALALRPELLVLDEPTTNLDVTTEAVVLDLLHDIRSKLGSSMVYISHNLGVVARIADRIAVMYAGEIVETAPAKDLFQHPRHPYTRALLDCIPGKGDTKRSRRLHAIPGALPSLYDVDAGCVFRERCDRRSSQCVTTPVWMAGAPGHDVRCWHPVANERGAIRTDTSATDLMPQTEPALDIAGITKRYGKNFLPFGDTRAPAVENASLSLPIASIVGLVGESGSGKTTLLRCIAGFEAYEAGSVLFQDQPLNERIGRRRKEQHRAIQMVFQDPESTLNPSVTVGENLIRHARALKGLKRPAALKAATHALSGVRLSRTYLDRLPTELSGGEKQRIAIARAFLADPHVVLCDEPLSALDVSVQAAVVQLLLDLQEPDKATYLLVSHDLSIIRYVADSIAVMYLGNIVEKGTAESYDAYPLHPYTEALFSAIPTINQNDHAPIRLEGQISEEDKLKPGCIFAARCPRHIGSICDTDEPPLRFIEGRQFCCHYEPGILASLQGSKAIPSNMEEK